MKKTAVLLLALLSGCWYDRPNPWRTESDRNWYLDKKEEDWLLEMEHPYELPRTPGVKLLLPDFEAFRDTVLHNATGDTLARMRDQSAAKIASLEKRAAALAPLDQSSKLPIYELLWEVRVERIRLQMIEDRISSR